MGASFPLIYELPDQDLVTTRSFFMPAFQCRQNYRQVFALLFLQVYFARFEKPHLVIYRRLSVRGVVNE
jgi:hypothetical protein